MGNDVQNGAPKSKNSRLGTQGRYLVKANIDLACAAEFVVHAVTALHAEHLGAEVLDETALNISAESVPGLDVFVNIPDYCADTIVVEVAPCEPDWLFDSNAVRANAVASIGTLIFEQIQRLALSLPQGAVLSQFAQRSSMG